MRLIDEILSCASGSDLDTQSFGTISLTADMIRHSEPQCFEITNDVAHACMTVYGSRPSSVVAALSYARLPYDNIWIERPFVPSIGKDGRDINAGKPPPRRVGALLLKQDGMPGAPSHSCALAMWAWSFPDETIHIAPFAMIFDWANKIDGQEITDSEINAIGKIRSARWHDYIGDEKELAAIKELRRHSGLLANPAALPFWQVLGIPGKPGRSWYQPDLDGAMITRSQSAMLASFTDDLASEDSIVTGFLLMLNSRNALTREPDDFTRLNKTRAKNRKPPLTEFIKTTLYVPRHLKQAFGNSPANRAAARLHMVRGHYKIRSSGVYWWTPHPRGRGKPVTRHQYTVKD